MLTTHEEEHFRSGSPPPSNPPLLMMLLRLALNRERRIHQQHMSSSFSDSCLWLLVVDLRSKALVNSKKRVSLVMWFQQAALVHFKHRRATPLPLDPITITLKVSERLSQSRRTDPSKLCDRDNLLLTLLHSSRNECERSPPAAFSLTLELISASVIYDRSPFTPNTAALILISTSIVVAAR